MSTMNLSTGEVQGHLRQLLETRKDLTSEERYSVMAAVEAMGFIKLIAPGLGKAMAELKQHLAQKG